VSKGYPLWCVLEKIEPYILLLSDTSDQANEFLDAIRQEVADNPAIARDYPQAAGVGPVWRNDRIRLRNGCQIVAKGAGSRVRGRSNRADRPTLVIGDDCNEKADAYSPTLRRRKWDWWTKDVMSVGTARTNFLVAGTPIHQEAISHKLRRTAGWQSRSYRSVIEWPERMDLWGEWERILSNLADDSAQVTARAYYEANRAEMDRGAVVLWPEWEPLYDLMRLRASIGASAFDSEKQDRPGTDGATEWPAEWFDDPDLWFTDWPETVCRIQGIDPSKAANSTTADWQAHGCLALGKDGVLYLEADLRREHVTAMCQRVIELAEVWQPDVVVAEVNSTMGLLTPELQRVMAERGKTGLFTYEELTSTDPKAARIRKAGSYLSRKQIKVRNTAGGRELVNQWRSWPNSEFDDGPDVAGVLIRRMEMYVRGRQ
jgi:hypothetical protein